MKAKGAKTSHAKRIPESDIQTMPMLNLEETQSEQSKNYLRCLTSALPKNSFFSSREGCQGLSPDLQAQHNIRAL